MFEKSQVESGKEWDTVHSKNEVIDPEGTISNSNAW